MKHPKVHRRRPIYDQWLILLIVCLSATILAGILATSYLVGKARHDLLKDNESAISVISVHLNDELKKIEAAVKAMSGSPAVISALSNRDDRNIHEANAALERYNSAMGTTVSYLMDNSGMTIASSDFNSPNSIIGQPFSASPYFVQSIQGLPGQGVYFSKSSSTRFFYASFPVIKPDRKIKGVVVMKIDLDIKEDLLKHYPYCFLVSQEGVVILSSRKDMLMKTLWPISNETQAMLIRSGQFGDKPFDPVFSQEISDRGEVTYGGVSYLVSRKTIGTKGWSIVLITPKLLISLYVLIGIITTAAIGTFIIIPFILNYKALRAARIVRENEERFKQVTQASRDWIWELDAEKRLTYSSQSVKNILDYEPEEVIGKQYHDFYFSEDREIIQEAVDAILGTNEPFSRVVTTMVHRNGYPVILESTGFPLFDEEANVAGFRGVSRDITDRRKTEESLRKSEQLYRSVIENINDTFYRTDIDGNLVMMSHSGKELFGYDAVGDMIGLNIAASLYQYPEDRKELLAEIEKHGFVKDYEVKLKRRDGTVIDVATSSHVYFDEWGRMLGIEGILRDITERKLIENELRNSEEKFRTLAENQISAIFLVQGTKYIYTNHAFEVMSGYSSDELAAMNYWDILHPDFQDIVKNRPLGRLKEDNSPSRHELKIITKNNEEGWVDVSAVVIDREGIRTIMGSAVDITTRKRAEEFYKTLADSSLAGIYIAQDDKMKFINNHMLGQYGYAESDFIGNSPLKYVYRDDRETVRAEALKMLKGKRTAPYECRIVDKKGNTRWLIGTVRSVIFEGRPAILGNSMDITERYQMEKMLRQSQKMEAIGTLAGGIAHDFNNILGVMIGYTDLAKAEMRPEKHQYYLDQVLRACDRAKNLVTQILAFSRHKEEERNAVLLAPIIREAVRMLRSYLPSTIRILHDISDEPIAIIADSTQIHQVLMNLGANASHAMREKGGILSIHLDIEKELPSGDFQPHEPATCGYAHLSVSDTGHGIDTAIIGRIFDPFFTTKEAGEGTGLGLSMVYGIVRNHHGVLDVSSEPMKGTTFNIYLPLVENRGISAEVMPEVDSCGNERILLVDDESSLIDVGSMMLKSLGYHVTSKMSGIEALDAFRANPQGFDLVITDTTMPNMTGVDLAVELLRIRPEIPIILCTGYSEIISEEEARNIGIRRFVMKPLSRQDLAKVIREVLE